MVARVPRLVLIVAVTLLAGGGLTFAAARSLSPTASPGPTAPLVQKLAVLIVPDVRNQAFVFAKGAIQDAGFAWRVAGGVHGFPANKVSSQSIPAGTHVLDNGAPVLTLTLVRDKKYPETGTPQDVSPYRATNAVLADAAGQPLAPAPAAAPKKSPAVAPSTPKVAPAATTAAAPAPAATTASPAPASTTAAPAPAATTAAPAAPAATPKSAYPQSRPVAFAVAGASKEPLDEMPLTDRASLLGRWLASHPKPTDKAVKYWLVQNEWIVTGARFGWWHGAEALRTLIQVDRRTVATWGIGSKSEAVAAGALAEVEARSH